MSNTKKKEDTTKIDQVGFGISFKSANPAEYPIAYQDDIWDVVEEDSKMANVLGGSGQYDQHTINEELAKASSDKVFEPGDVQFSAKQVQEDGKENTASEQGSFAGGESSQALGKNSFAFGDHATSIGEGAFALGKNSYAGIYGWYYKYLDFTTGTFYLTTEQPDVRKVSDMGPEPEVDSSFESGFAVGDVISYVNKAKRDMYATITEVNGNKIVVGTLNDSELEILEEHPNHDDWTIFVPEKPEAGEIWLGECAFAEGSSSKAINAYSHAEGGKGCLAYGQYSHAEGKATKAGYASHAEGESTEAAGTRSHAEGIDTHSLGHFSHAEGGGTVAGDGAKKAGRGESGSGYFTHAEGTGTLAKGNAAHAEGRDTQAIGENSHAEGNGTQAKKSCSHTEGSGTIADGWCAHAEGGEGSKATGSQSHAEGTGTTASGNYSHAEGATTTASGGRSHAEGMDTLASGEWSHAEGANTVAGNSAKKNSRGETTTGYFTHAEGNGTLAKGNAAHAEGVDTQAIGDGSHSEGGNTQTQNRYEHAQGSYNKSNKGGTDFGNAGNTIHSIGIGTSSERKNAVEVMQDGKVFIKDVGGYIGTNPTGQPNAAKDLATVLSGMQGQLTEDQITALNWCITHRQNILHDEAQAKFAISTNVSGNTYVADTTTQTTMTVTATLKFDGTSVEAKETPSGWTWDATAKTYTKSLTGGSGSIAAQSFTYKVSGGEYSGIEVSGSSAAKSISATYPIYYGFVNTSNPDDLKVGGIIDIAGKGLTRSQTKYTNATATLTNGLSESGYFWILTHSSATATQSGTSILKSPVTVTLKSPQNSEIDMTNYKLYISSNSAAPGGSFDLVNININI